MSEISEKEFQSRKNIAEAAFYMTKSISETNKKLNGLTPGEWLSVLHLLSADMIELQLKQDAAS